VVEAEAVEAEGECWATGAAAALQPMLTVSRRDTRSPRLRNMRGIMPRRGAREPLPAS
jgi:hypothetical protein